MRPEVSAVITTHGRPAVVRDALASVRAERQASLEIIVVDDGGDFIADAPVRVVRGSDLGVARARNLGLANARGEFVIYLDDDDVAFPNRIFTLLRAAREHRADLCFGMTARVIEGSTAFLEDVPTHVVSSGAVSFSDLLTCAPHVNAVLARTEVLRAAGGFDASVDHFDDWAAWLRIADRGAKIWRVAETVAEWRLHRFGLSGRLLDANVMKLRILTLFDRLETSLPRENSRAIASARRLVERSEIRTYDDYVEMMAGARAEVGVA